MSDYVHTVLCVDDEENIVHSLKRLLRKEDYRLLTASSGEEGLKLLEANEVHLVMSDQRMPHMSGTEFLSIVKNRYPDTIRIVLTGFTEVDAITESINKGHIYKFFLKPWNDQSLMLEIRQALDQYDLVRANKDLHRKVMEQNKELSLINENLEEQVRRRTEELEIHNQILELSRSVMEDLPIPVIGITPEGMIVVINKQAETLRFGGHSVQVGLPCKELFPEDMQEAVANAFASGASQRLGNYGLSNRAYDIDIMPLSGKFRGRGVVMSFVGR